MWNSFASLHSCYLALDSQNYKLRILTSYEDDANIVNDNFS